MILTLCCTAAGSALVGLLIGQFIARCPEEEGCHLSILEPAIRKQCDDSQSRIGQAILASLCHVTQNAPPGAARLGSLKLECMGPDGVSAAVVLVMDEQLFDRVIKPVLGDQYTVEERKV